MSLLHADVTLPMACSICSEPSHSFNTLHQHHLLCHTAEELSIALISFKEPKKTMTEVENECLLFTQPCGAQIECCIAAADEDNGQNKQAEQNNEKRDTEGNLTAINSDEKKVEIVSKSKLEAIKCNNIHKNYIYLCDAELQELDTSIFFSMEKQNTSLNSNGTNREYGVLSEIATCTINEHKSNTNDNASKGHRKVNKENNETQSNMPKLSIIHSKMSHRHEDSEVVVLDMECIDDLDRLSTERMLEEGSSSSVAENFSTDSEPNMLPQDISSQSEICVQAIVTRLSNIVKAASEPVDYNSSNCKQNAHKNDKENYILPSPLKKYHLSKVAYNYGSLGNNERCTEDIIDDFFRPSIKMDGFKDAMCETIPTDFSEKEIQVSFDSPAQLSDLQQSNAAEREQYEKYTQTGIMSLTTRRLAAYRKPPRNLGQIDNNSTTSSNYSFTVSKISAKLPEKKPQIYPKLPSDRRFFCELCGKGYKKKSHLERHVRVHTGERPFPCPYCEKRFAVRSILKQHVRTHTGEKPYCCTLCLQHFPQKSGLMTHTMLHTGKPFKCDKCEKAFVSNHKLLQHLRSHGGKSGRKNTCSVCKTEFLTEGAMLQHRHIHNSKPFAFSQF